MQKRVACVRPRMPVVRGFCDPSRMDPDCAEALPFESRTAAGVALARRLAGIHWRDPAIVLGLPRGGVPVAKAVASALHLPLDVLVVRKISHPNHPEFAIGAVASGGITVRNNDQDSSISRQRFDGLATEQRIEVERRALRLRPGREPLSLIDKTAILVDDGVATGATMRAALASARAMGAAHVIIAVPVGAREVVNKLAERADEIICLYCPEPFQSVGFYYANFSQLHDADVRAALGNPDASPF
jgi:putative phosphoribosyl transferase